MADGTVWKTIYTEGVKTWYHRQGPTGIYWEEHYTAQGVLCYEEFYNPTDEIGYPTGYTTVFTIGSNGLPTFSVNTTLDGNVYEVTYDGNGNAVSWKNIDKDGEVTTGKFDTSGAPVSP